MKEAGLVGQGAAVSSMTRELTPFQLSLHSAVQEAFRESGRTISWTTCGENEAFLYGTSVSLDAEVWLYEDEAECRFGRFRRLCERPDFDSLQEMQSYFLAAVKDGLKKSC